MKFNPNIGKTAPCFGCLDCGATKMSLYDLMMHHCPDDILTHHCGNNCHPPHLFLQEKTCGTQLPSKQQANFSGFLPAAITITFHQHPYEPTLFPSYKEHRKFHEYQHEKDVSSGNAQARKKECLDDTIDTTVFNTPQQPNVKRVRHDLTGHNFSKISKKPPLKFCHAEPKEH